jgi:uncharacterized protein with HEPN domain
MSNSGLESIRHILDEIQFIFKYTAGKNSDQVFHDEVLRRAVIRSIEIIGEAVKKVPPGIKSAHPEIEWRKMAGTRDILIYNYMGVDFDIVWHIIEDKLPNLEKQLVVILNNS